jgi:hypothetical protein
MDASRHRRASIARWLIWLYAMGQLAVLLHPLVVDHAICPHGEVVDIHHHEDAGHDCGHSSGGHGDGENHDGCQQLAYLTAPRAIEAEPAELVELAELANEVPPAEQAGQDHQTTEIYLIAPSNSPPPRG